MNILCGACGATFEGPDSAGQQEICCPKCGQPVAAPGRRSAQPTSEGARRRRNLILLGVFLLVAFLMPTLVPDTGNHSASDEKPLRWTLPNLELLVSAYAEDLGKSVAILPLAILCLAPLATGLVALFASGIPHPARGVVLVLLPFFLLLSMLGLSGNPFAALAIAAKILPLSVSLSLAVSVVTLLLLLVAIRTRYYRPTTAAPHFIAILGLIVYVVYLAIPVDGSTLKTAAGASPFILMQNNAPGTVVTAEFLKLAIPLVGFVLCLIGAPSRGSAAASFMASLALWVTAAGYALVFALYAVVLLEAVSVELASAILLNMVKFGACLVGVFLLIPTGIVDLMIGQPPKEQPAAASPVTSPA